MSASSKQTVTDNASDGAVDLGDQAWVSPAMEAVLAGDPVIFDMSVGEVPPASVEGDTAPEVE